MLNQYYKCKFYCIVNDRGVCYKAFVENNEKSDYINMTKLPFDIKYMAYYLQETISLKLDKDEKYDSVSLQMIDMQQFARKMEDLQRRMLGDDAPVRIAEGKSPVKQ